MPAISGCANANGNEPEVEEEKEEFVKEHDLTNDEINSVLNVLDVNAFEIRGNDFSIRGKNNSFIGLVLTLKITIVCPKELIWAVFCLVKMVQIRCFPPKSSQIFTGLWNRGLLKV